MDRAELYAVLDGYLAALQDRAPQRLHWVEGAKTSENNVMLEVGDGLWGTIDRLGDYDLRFADTRTRQVGFFGVTHEHAEESGFALRLKVAADGAIAVSISNRDLAKGQATAAYVVVPAGR